MEHHIKLDMAKEISMLQNKKHAFHHRVGALEGVIRERRYQYGINSK